MSNKNELTPIFVRVKGVSQMLGVSETTVWRWASNRSINGFPKPKRTGGNVTVWRRSEVLDWMERELS